MEPFIIKKTNEAQEYIVLGCCEDKYLVANLSTGEFSNHDKATLRVKYKFVRRARTEEYANPDADYEPSVAIV